MGGGWWVVVGSRVRYSKPQGTESIARIMSAKLSVETRRGSRLNPKGAYAQIKASSHYKLFSILPNN
ncbi:MAG: hypothetical protein ACHBN1_13705 [Heteroscytonema crispum UTEX LB 1556]